MRASSLLVAAVVVIATPSLASAQDTGHALASPVVSSATTAARIAYEPAPMRDRSTRPSFGTSIALHVTAAIAGPVGLAGLIIGASFGVFCGWSSTCDIAAVFALAGAILETASLAIGISATAVHARTRARVRDWEAGTARIQPWGGPSGGGASFVLAF